MKKLIISVTQDDIDSGARCNAGYCPIALAFARHNLKVTITPYWITIYENDSNWSTNLPAEARVFVKDFDSTENVKPFSFEIDLTKKINDLNSITV